MVKPTVWDVLEQVLDDEPCWLDHHGYCQEHGLVENCLVPRGRELLETKPMSAPAGAKWPELGTRLRKKKGSSWQGRIVGFYSTSLTPIGYAIESEREPGSVQIYPEAALEEVPE